MTNETILKKAIEKAESNGWDGGYWNLEADGIKSSLRLMIDDKSYLGIIFAHDFAKSFWDSKLTLFGPVSQNDDEAICNDCKRKLTVSKDLKCGHRNCPKGSIECWNPDWKVHLQQMVILENPIKYLEQFLK